MGREVDLTVLEPYTAQEIQGYIAYLWQSGATDVAAAVLGALRHDEESEPRISPLVTRS